MKNTIEMFFILLIRQLRQHAASIYGFGILTALTNIRSTKVLWKVEDDLQWKKLDPCTLLTPLCGIFFIYL